VQSCKRTLSCSLGRQKQVLHVTSRIGSQMYFLLLSVLVFWKALCSSLSSLRESEPDVLWVHTRAPFFFKEIINSDHYVPLNVAPFFVDLVKEKVYGYFMQNNATSHTVCLCNCYFRGTLIQFMWTVCIFCKNLMTIIWWEIGNVLRWASLWIKIHSQNVWGVPEGKMPVLRESCIN
jgi:hypothetical protein